MERRHVRYILALREILNFTRAAENYNVARPSLTRAIKKLEDELGRRLSKSHCNSAPPALTIGRRAALTRSAELLRLRRHRNKGEFVDKVIVLHTDDNVATCLANLKRGEVAEWTHRGERLEIRLGNDVPFGHKFAIAEIPAGTEVRKYGEVIGIASKSIAAGAHVHVHNVDSARARGDKTADQVNPS